MVSPARVPPIFRLLTAKASAVRVAKINPSDVVPREKTAPEECFSIMESSEINGGVVDEPGVEPHHIP